MQNVFGFYFSEQAGILEITSLSLAVSQLYFFAVNPSFFEHNQHVKCRHKRFEVGVRVRDKEYLFTPSERPNSLESWGILEHSLRTT